MKPSHIVSALSVSFIANRTAFLWGQPATAKSDLVRQAAKEWAAKLIESGNLDPWNGQVPDLTDRETVRKLCKVISLPLFDPTDLKGIQNLTDVGKDGATYFTRPAIIPRKGDGCVCLFFDEFPMAPPMVQGACYSILLDGEINGYYLPDYVRRVAAGNRKADRGVNHELSPANRSRMVHFDVEPDNDDWLKWAIEHDIRVEVMAFIRWRPELLHKFDSANRSFPNYRAWHMVSDFLNAGMPAEIEQAVFAGLVGEGAATEFVGFLRVYRQLPLPETVLMNPANAPIPSEPSARFAIATALARKAQPDNMDAVVAYMGRFTDSQGNPQPHYGVLCINDAVTVNPKNQHTRAFAQWITQNNDVIFN